MAADTLRAIGALIDTVDRADSALDDDDDEEE